MSWGRALLGSDLFYWMSLFICSSLFSNVTYCQSTEPPRDELQFYYGNTSQLVATTNSSAYWTTTFKCKSTGDFCFQPVKNHSLRGEPWGRGFQQRQTVNFELPRLGQVFAIAFPEDYVKIDYTGRRNLETVSIVRRLSSHVNKRTDCTADEKVMFTRDSQRYMVFLCNETQQLNHVLSSGIIGDFITVSLIGDSGLNRVPRSKEIILVRDLLVANNRTGDEGHCLGPGKFPAQIHARGSLDPLFAPNEPTIYQCYVDQWRLYEIQSSRTCVRGEWLGDTPRCMPKTSAHPITSQCAVSETEEPRYFLNKNFFEVSIITAAFKVKSRQDCETASKRQISIGSGAQSREQVRISSSEHQYDDEGWCDITFSTVDDHKAHCTNCTILLNLTGVALAEESCHFTIESIYEKFERLQWWKSGCPPIDPYVGMPEEYKDEAAMNHSDLNSRLIEKPCRDGFFHIGNKENVKQCVFNGTFLEWMGSSPKCKLITCKRPPSVEGAFWRYTNDSAFHEIQYTCRTAWKMESGEGIARCNYDLNEWEGVPTCKWFGSNATSCSQLPFTEADRNHTLNGVLYSYVGVHEYCLMDERNKVRIQLNRLSQITHIGININATENARDNVIATVIRDASVSVTCSYTEEYNYDVDDHFVFFECQEEGAPWEGVLGHSVEIFARGETPSLDLKHSSPQIVWIRAALPFSLYNEHCIAPGMYPNQKLSRGDQKLYKHSEVVSYSCCNNNSCVVGDFRFRRECDASKGRWYGSPPRDCQPTDDKRYGEWIKRGCPPIDPYIGMPDEYAGEAAMNHSELNKRLRERPCRDGYRNIDRQSNNIMQCVEDDESFEWEGELPKCILMACKQPPSVANAEWRYVSNSSFHEVRYTCRAPFKLEKGEGIAKCNESSEWNDVPHCVGGGADESRNAITSSLTITIIVLLLVLVVTVPLIFLRKTTSFFRPMIAVRVDADYVLPANNASNENTPGDAQFGSERTYQYVASRNSAVDHAYCELDDAIYSELDYGYLSPKVSVQNEHEKDSGCETPNDVELQQVQTQIVC